jgi:iron complex outermembrane receptor protein
VGQLGKKDLLDTPYSMSVIPQELIENVQASNPDKILELSPFVQFNQQSTRGSFLAYPLFTHTYHL